MRCDVLCQSVIDNVIEAAGQISFEGRRVEPSLNPENKANLSSRENSHTVVAS